VRVGIFGGSFDPVHRGHLEPVAEVAGRLGLERVEFVVSRVSPFKPEGPRADARHRIAMLALGLAGRPDFRVSFAELDRDGISFTVDTVRMFESQIPADRLYLLLGTDALAGFSRWREPGEIVRRCRLAAFVRDGFEAEDVSNRPDLAPFRDSFLIFDSVRVKISSTDVRRRIVRGESIAGLTPPGVEEYIFKQGLYRAPDEAEPV
jgi:nicotinate-nucleotide adenylyltransferase